jgi:pimeloyl-ACP methyl ester carboxylesterase
MRDLRVKVDGATLAGSYSPAGETALVALHGASGGTRDDEILQQLHRVLPPAGIGVVTFDRRGEGASTGRPSVGQFELQARDVLAVAAALEAPRVGLWGFSQGGWVAPIAATMSERVAFLVLIASTGVTPHEQMLFANEQQLRRAGYGADVISRVLGLRRELEAWTRDPDPAAGAALAGELAAGQGEAWWALTYLPPRLPDDGEREEWAAEMTFDPLPIFRGVTVPTLLFYGADDGWTPVEASAAAWREAAADRVEVVVIPGAAHDLALSDGRRAPDYEERLVDWCLRRSRD